MRRLIAAGILLTLIFSAIFAGNRITSDTCTDLKEWLTVSEKNILDGDWEGARADINSKKDKWERKEKVLSAFLNRQALDEISVSINELSAAVSLNDTKLSVIKCAEIKAFIKEIEEKEQFGIMSFF